MSAAANLSAPPESRSGRLLALVRRLIDYGKALAASLQHRTDPDQALARRFGTRDIALILGRIACGLHRAGFLEARIVRGAVRLDVRLGPAAARAPGAPRAARPPAPVTDAAPSPLASLPSARQIAAEVRRRPIGAVLADICRDLGIVPAHPLWGELSDLVIRHGGSLAALVRDVLDRLCPLPPVARWPAVAPAPTASPPSIRPP